MRNGGWKFGVGVPIGAALTPRGVEHEREATRALRDGARPGRRDDVRAVGKNT
jgi:hypothetical protein